MVFGPGQLFFINMSEMTVFGYVGDKKLISKPQTTEIIEQPREGTESYMLKLDSFNGDLSTRRKCVQQRCQYRPDERIGILGCATTVTAYDKSPFSMGSSILME
ncbi:Unannotated [Lentimonas sp. CC19]|nr:Unannotated [Lentimonas sp. CC10]CAA6692085.1 Unannotated [Lentimonas sp. CC19]CAA7070662.1 Unannotated [Lentimonas sp. CC11]